LKASLNKNIEKSFSFFAALLVTAILLFPLFITLLTSLKPPGEVITATPQLLSDNFNLNNYLALFRIREFPRYLLNSLTVAVYTTLMSTGFSLLAAFAFVWLDFRGKNVLTRSIFFTYMFPSIIIVVPLFMMVYRLGLIDNKLALAVIYLSLSLPFSIWMLKGYFESIPIELVQIALLDGCSYFGILTRIIVPMSMPAIAAVAAFAFLLGWSEYLFASTIISTDYNRTVAVGLQTLLGYYRTDYGLLTAAGIVVVAPILVMFMVAQRYLLSGLTAGAIKE
jgi:multiple sugar transport system permease protein